MVVSPKDLEEQCRQPVAIANAVSMIVMIPAHIVGMFVLFSKAEKMFNPARLAANARQMNAKNRRTHRQAFESK